MDTKTKIKVIAADDNMIVGREKLVVGTLVLIGILNVLLIVTRGMSGF
jgi:hypothetical protein